MDAYGRLVARGFLESRRGSGFFVRDRIPVVPAVHAPHPTALATDAPPHQLDMVWLVRNMFRQLPPEKTPGLGSLPDDWLDGVRVARHFLQPGVVIFVDDPAWFLMFGSFATLGAKMVGIPRPADGPDIARLSALAALHRPKLYVINSVLDNPTSASLSAAMAFKILKIAEQHDFMIVENDIYGDVHPGSSVQSATRIAANTWNACAASPTARDRTMRQLEKAGLKVDIHTSAGMFVWTDTGCDTNRLTEQATAQGFLLAHGSLFSPDQLPSSRKRVNVATMADPGIWRFFEQALGRA